MIEREQVRSLTPSIESPSNNGENITLHLQTRTTTKFKITKRCVCPLVFLLLIAVVTIILVFTIFRAKDSVITLNSFQFTKLELAQNILLPKPGVNVSLVADVSVSNPNVASFRYGNTTTSLYYHGVMIGEARGPPGKARARRSTRMNVTVDVSFDHVIKSSNFMKDLSSGVVTMNSFSRVPGQLNIFNLIKRHAIVKMNCTTTFNIFSLVIEEYSCKRKVKF